MMAFSRLGLSGLASDMDWFGYRPGNIICVRMMAQGAVRVYRLGFCGGEGLRGTGHLDRIFAQKL